MYTGSENGDAEDLQNGEHKMLCKGSNFIILFMY